MQEEEVILCHVTSPVKTGTCYHLLDTPALNHVVLISVCESNVFFLASSIFSNPDFVGTKQPSILI